MDGRLLMLDLFSGLGGASAAMRERSHWRVVRVDINPAVRPDIMADVRTFAWRGPRPTLVWASPPCEEFSRESMPWCRTGHPPDLGLIVATLQFVRSVQPVFWVLENVRGAQRWIGRAPYHAGPFYLWGYYPPFRAAVRVRKEHLSSAADLRRAQIPYALSAALADAVEEALGMRPLVLRPEESLLHASNPRGSALPR
jgi:site-specific DNA-cytosine methylase